MGKDIVITYETLFELLRREKGRAELQKIDDSFFVDVVEYLRDKYKIVAGGNQDDLFSFGEKEKAEKQLFNIKRILKELYDRREKKIVGMALDKAKTGAGGLMDTGAMLRQEKQLFDSIVNTVVLFRGEIVHKLLENEHIKESIMETKNIFDQNKEAAEEKGWNKLFKVVETKGYDDEADIIGNSTDEDEQRPDSQEEEKDTLAEFKSADGLANSTVESTGDGSVSVEPEIGEKEETFTSIRFLEHVPKFVGLELEEYGPYEPDDTASMPSILAEVLIGKKRAEKFSND